MKTSKRLLKPPLKEAAAHEVESSVDFFLDLPDGDAEL